MLDVEVLFIPVTAFLLVVIGIQTFILLLRFRPPAVPPKLRDSVPIPSAKEVADGAASDEKPVLKGSDKKRAKEALSAAAEKAVADTLRKEVKQLHKALNELKRSADEEKKGHAAAKIQIEALSTEKEQLLSKVETFERNTKSLKSASEAGKKQISTLEQSVSVKSKELEKLRAQLTNMDNSLATARSDLSSATQTHKTELANQKESTSKLQKDLDEASKQRQAAEESGVRLQSSLDDLQKQLSESQEASVKMQGEMKATLARASSETPHTQALRKEIRTLKLEIQRLEELAQRAAQPEAAPQASSHAQRPSGMMTEADILAEQQHQHAQPQSQPQQPSPQQQQQQQQQHLQHYQQQQQHTQQLRQQVAQQQQAQQPAQQSGYSGRPQGQSAYGNATTQQPRAPPQQTSTVAAAAPAQPASNSAGTAIAGPGRSGMVNLMRPNVSDAVQQLEKVLCDDRPDLSVAIVEREVTGVFKTFPTDVHVHSALFRHLITRPNASITLFERLLRKVSSFSQRELVVNVMGDIVCSGQGEQQKLERFLQVLFPSPHSALLFLTSVLDSSGVTTSTHEGFPQHFTYLFERSLRRGGGAWGGSAVDAPVAKDLSSSVLSLIFRSVKWWQRCTPQTPASSSLPSMLIRKALEVRVVSFQDLQQFAGSLPESQDRPLFASCFPSET
eukprot:NODE_402_length_2109_cov_41.042233_g323_i0.p1 GENE.NODE_402_length_2109_cov_41.042233_g323_i0~~NODE_402_length_2109_cov_41.042233_g323_i0.p1  ORF type:complete len:683 (+),score=131.73 NODE_402_length_2109_cov_41.042233_g323_i0:27-2051(+)